MGGLEEVYMDGCVIVGDLKGVESGRGPGVAVGGGAGGRQRGGGGSAGGPRPRALQKKAQPATRHTRVRRTGAARELPVPARGWEWLRGTAGAGRAGASVRAGGKADLHPPPMPSANRKRAAGESHSRPTTAWGVPRTPPAIGRLGGRSPVVVAWSSQSSPPVQKKHIGRVGGKPFWFFSAFFSCSAGHATTKAPI